MIVEEYFRVRSDLVTALFFLQTLAHETHATREVVQALQDASASLREPFLFVAIGAKRSGKSSLLNALFGRELCPVETPSQPDVVHLLKYGSREKEVPLSEGILACYRPIFLLRDFTLADTPGGPIHQDGQRALAEQFFPRADLIFFVVSVVDPWDAQAWERLQFLDQRSLKNLVIIVQQSDLRNPVEVDAVVEHLKQVALEKLSTRVPVFSISAKTGYIAKTSGLDKARLLAESGLERLEKFINEKVTRGSERWGALRSVWQKGDGALQNLGAGARAEFSVIKQYERILVRIESTLQNEKQQSLRQVNGEIWSLSQLYERAQKRGEGSLERELSFWGVMHLLLFGGGPRENAQGNSGKEFAEAVKTHVEAFLAGLKSNVGGLWKETHESLPQSLSAHDDEQTPPELFTEDGDLMIEKLALTIREQSAAGPLQQNVSAAFADIRRWLGIAAAGYAISIIAFIFAPNIVATVIGVAAVAVGSWGTVAALLKRREILRQFVTAVVTRREE
jgi:GTP-binding protein EngB required for normal cell division